MGLKHLIATSSMVASFLQPAVIVASETDQYYAWGYELRDAAPIFNPYFNHHVRKSLAKFKGKRFERTCEDVAEKVGIDFSITGMYAATKGWVQKHPDIETWPPADVSDKDYFEASILRDGKYLVLAKTINFNGVNIGTDKLAHSIQFGYVYYHFYQTYYKRALADGFSQAAARQKATYNVIRSIGVRSEQWILGAGIIGPFTAISTGFYSFADLEANFQGFMMYRDFCEGDRPYLKMQRDERGRTEWVLDRPIDFGKYVNPMWDESYNPSWVRPDLWPMVRERMKSYCAMYTHPLVMATFARYEQKKNQVSYNTKTMRELVSQGIISGSENQSIAAVCGPEAGN